MFMQKRGGVVENAEAARVRPTRPQKGTRFCFIDKEEEGEQKKPSRIPKVTCADNP
jgi:hypothetical protein